MKELYNLNLLLENADSLTVALHIGMEVVSKGRYNYIQCPGHLDYLGKYDNKISNAILTNNGYHCFACNRSVSLINMVQEYYKNYLSVEIDFTSACEIIAETCGGKDMYLISKNTSSSENKPQETFILSKKELELINIATTSNNKMIQNTSNIFIQNSSKKYKKHYKYNEILNDFDVEYLEYYNEPTSIYTFYNEDKLNCIEMLLDKTEEKRQEMQNILNMIDNVDVTKFFKNSFTQNNNLLPILKDQIMKDYMALQTIQQKLEKTKKHLIFKEVKEETLEEVKEEKKNIVNSVIYRNLYNIDNINEKGPLV